MKWLIVLRIIVLWLPTTLYAFTDQQVIDWSSNVMVKTLSASYLDTPADIANVRKNYMLAAWGPMLDFFVEKRAYIQQNQLILHPTPLAAATLEEKGMCHNLPCWRVDQSFSVPEIKSNVDMSLLVTTVGIDQESLIVQSMDVNLRSL